MLNRREALIEDIYAPTFVKSLGSEILVDRALDVDAYDRSIGVLARYEVPLGEDVHFGVGFGLRYALVETDSDDVEVSVADPASNLSLSSGVGVAWNISDELRLRGDVMAGVSIAARRLVDERGEPAGDLGVMALDVVVGFELSL
jgi:hypothetical protein